MQVCWYSRPINEFNIIFQDSIGPRAERLVFQGVLTKVIIKTSRKQKYFNTDLQTGSDLPEVSYTIIV